jgi:hypothetical protein
VHISADGGQPVYGLCVGSLDRFFVIHGQGGGNTT